MKHKTLMAPSSGGVQNMSFNSGDENVTTSPRSHEIVIAVDFKDTGNFPDIFYYLYHMILIRIQITPVFSKPRTVEPSNFFVSLFWEITACSSMQLYESSPQ